jgi:hypothetical protein
VREFEPPTPARRSQEKVLSADNISACFPTVFESFVKHAQQIAHYTLLIAN